MDRWTERFTSDGEKAIAIHDGSDFPDVCFEGEREYDVMNALAEYEDLEEQGLLVRLPCKVGEDVYEVNSYVGCDNDKCDDLYSSVHCFNCKFEKEFYYIQKIKFNFDNLDDVGRTIFITKEEVEKKLEEMEHE